MLGQLKSAFTAVPLSVIQRPIPRLGGEQFLIVVSDVDVTLDAAPYPAKDSGRNRVAVAESPTPSTLLPSH